MADPVGHIYSGGANISMALTLNQRSQFLALPPELLNHVYELIFESCTRTASNKIVLPVHVPECGYTVLAMLQTCQQILDEAHGLFYLSLIHI